MRFPTTRYGNPEALKQYTLGMQTEAICKRLKRSKKTVLAWRNGDRKMPWWVPELLRLQNLERNLILKQMGMSPPLGIVKGQIIDLHRKKTVLHGAETVRENHKQELAECSKQFA